MIPIRFKCKACGLNVEDARVRERVEGEPTDSWFGAVNVVIEEHHKKHSPTCKEKRVDLQIKKFSGKGLGFPAQMPVFLNPSTQIEIANKKGLSL